MSAILLTGKDGQVGWELQRTLAPLGDVVATDRRVLDLANPDSIRTVVRSLKPGIIVNAAAYTAVDQAESEPDAAMAVNGVAPSILAEEARKLGALLVHFSTDYVFDGARTTPYTEKDEPNPLNVYGRSKLAGERAIQAAGAAHFILRTGWVYGLRGKNFLLTMLRLAKEREELRIVNDQIGAPTWCRMIAEATARILERRKSHPELPLGIYHLSAAGQTSWHGFAGQILAMTGTHSVPRLIPIPSSEYPLPARRPKYSVLSNAAFERDWKFKLPDWNESLRTCLSAPERPSVQNHR